MIEQNVRGAHLVGSVPLATSSDVFSLAAGILGGHLRRLPDGETGDRTNWINWQLATLSAMPEFETLPPARLLYRPFPTVRLRAGIDSEQLRFGSLGYRDAAIESYRVFARLKEEGVIPARCRFQVCLPTPLATVQVYVEPRSRSKVAGPYRRKLLEELDDIIGHVPAGELAVQWDTAVEFAVLEGLWPTWFENAEAGIVAMLAALGDRVPAQVEMGYHFCYGDAGHKHFVEPKDTSLMVRIANAVFTEVERRVDWLHLPVPIGRSDADYFRPLSGLRLDPETELYLGLVHMTDGAAGARKRIEAAREFAPKFGVATECGFGRRPAETVPDLMRIHAEVADAL